MEALVKGLHTTISLPREEPPDDLSFLNFAQMLIVHIKLEGLECFFSKEIDLLTEKTDDNKVLPIIEEVLDILKRFRTGSRALPNRFISTYSVWVIFMP